MNWESIGSTSTGDMPEDEAWILLSLSLAKSFILHACGDPPPGCEIEVMWHDHELGSYPSLGIGYLHSCPDNYISSAEEALQIFDDSISWSALKEHADSCEVTEDESDEDDEFVS